MMTREGGSALRRTTVPDMREEFEAWWSSPAQWELRKSCARGWAEIIWRASRAALKVDIPEGFDIGDGSGAIVYYVDEIVEALQQAGIEVK